MKNKKVITSHTRVLIILNHNESCEELAGKVAVLKGVTLKLVILVLIS